MTKFLLLSVGVLAFLASAIEAGKLDKRINKKVTNLNKKIIKKNQFETSKMGQLNKALDAMTQLNKVCEELGDCKKPAACHHSTKEHIDEVRDAIRAKMEWTAEAKTENLLAKNMAKMNKKWKQTDFEYCTCLHSTYTENNDVCKELKTAQSDADANGNNKDDSIQSQSISASLMQGGGAQAQETLILPTQSNSIQSQSISASLMQGGSAQAQETLILPLPGNAIKTTACEDAGHMLSCINGPYKGQEINIISADWGRSKKNFCGASDTNTNCHLDLETVYSKVGGLCNRKGSCGFPTTNSFFGGDPCSGTNKYITIEHECVWAPDDLPCNYEQCKNQGTCKNSADRKDFTCECPPNFSGKQCEVETPPECKDDATACEHWATIGECTKNPGYMLSFCKKSCDVCNGGSGVCSAGTCKNGGKCRVQLNRANEKFATCECSSQFLGKNCEFDKAKVPEHCSTLFQKDQGTYTGIAGKDGVFWWCENGWWVIQSRDSNSYDFNRDYQQYDEGFGDLWSDHWSGLEKIERFCEGNQACWLRIEQDGHWATYEYFYLLKEVRDNKNLYRINLSKPDPGSIMADLHTLNYGLFGARDYDPTELECVKHAKSPGGHSGGWWFPPKTNPFTSFEQTCTNDFGLNDLMDTDGTPYARTRMMVRLRPW